LTFNSGTKKKLISIAIVFLLVLSVTSGTTFAETTDGGTVSTVPSSSGITVSEASINETTNSEVDIAYNATAYVANGSVTQDDLGVRLSWAGGSSQVDVTNSEGTANLTIPADSIQGGEHVYTAVVTNLSSGEVIAPTFFGQAPLHVSSNVTVDSYSVSKTELNTSESFWINTTVTNTGPTTEDFTVAGYLQTSSVLGDTVVTVQPGETKSVNQSFDIPFAGEWDIQVNNETTTMVNVTDSGASGGSDSGSVEIVSASLVSDEVAAGGNFTVYQWDRESDDRLE